MSDTFCECASARTRKFVSDNKNVCPTCNKTLIEEEPIYEKAVEPLPALEQEKDSDMSKLLELLGGQLLAPQKTGILRMLN